MTMRLNYVLYGLSVLAIELICLLPLAAAGAAPDDQGRPPAELLQTIKAADLPGLRQPRFSPVAAAAWEPSKYGQYLYVSGDDGLVYFKWDKDKLPRVDAVLYTHRHPDHFTLATPKVLERKLKPLYILTSPGVEALRKIGVDDDRLIDPERIKSHRVGPVEITATPAQHGGGWAVGYLVKTPDGTMWHPGDTDLIDKLLAIRGVDVLLFDIAAVDRHLGAEGSAWPARSWPTPGLKAGRSCSGRPRTSLPARTAAWAASWWPTAGPLSTSIPGAPSRRPAKWS